MSESIHRAYTKHVHVQRNPGLSLAGFQSGSNITKRLAPMRFRPHPPAFLTVGKRAMEQNSGAPVIAKFITFYDYRLYIDYDR